MIEVGAYPTRSEAELAQGALAAAGIRSEIAADTTLEAVKAATGADLVVSEHVGAFD